VSVLEQWRQVAVCLSMPYTIHQQHPLAHYQDPEAAVRALRSYPTG